MNRAEPSDWYSAGGRSRWWMLSLVMLVTAVNFLDRANLAIAGPVIQREMGFDARVMGIVFSAFGWAYTLFLPLTGALLDRVGPRIVYGVAVAGWSLATALIGFANSLGSLLGCRVMVGLFEAPSIPTNVRVVAAWFPTSERASAVGLYTAMQYVALGLLTPILAWMLVRLGWRWIFYVTGLVGFVTSVVWYMRYRDPAASTASTAELRHITAGGGLGDTAAATDDVHAHEMVGRAFRLLRYRQVWGMFVGQFSVNTTLFFFLTWFPSYLIAGRGLTVLKGGIFAAVPFLVAISGTLVAGRLSDWIVTRGYGLGYARKGPIIAGLALSGAIVGANYVSSVGAIIAFMSIASFGQAVASTITGALLSDVAPKGMVGTLGGMLYFVANVGGTLAPIVIGFLVAGSKGFNLALGYVSLVAALGVAAYLFLLGAVRRLELPE
jgi:MFS transporter, ACS family, D-galactonate transporter